MRDECPMGEKTIRGQSSAMAVDVSVEHFYGFRVNMIGKPFLGVPRCSHVHSFTATTISAQCESWQPHRPRQSSPTRLKLLHRDTLPLARRVTDCFHVDRTQPSDSPTDEQHRTRHGHHTHQFTLAHRAPSCRRLTAPVLNHCGRCCTDEAQLLYHGAQRALATSARSIPSLERRSRLASCRSPTDRLLPLRDSAPVACPAARPFTHPRPPLRAALALAAPDPRYVR
jgi:hypothetical protein